MKRYVNGEEVDLQESPEVVVTPLSDRLIVRTPEGSSSALAVRVGDVVHVSYKGQVYKIEKGSGRSRGASGVASGEIRASMPGLIVEVLVSEGAKVELGEKLVILEAMKTQQTFTAPFEGTVGKVSASKGQQVQEGQILVQVEAGSEE